MMDVVPSIVSGFSGRAAREIFLQAAGAHGVPQEAIAAVDERRLPIWGSGVRIPSAP